MEDEVGRRAEVMEVAEVDLELVVRGTTLEGVVEEEVVEVVERGTEEEMMEDDEEFDEVGRGARVMDFAEKGLEAVEWGIQEEAVVKLVVGVGRRAEVMEVAEED
eukprot:SM000051S17612  [mRNA]  locus=s51:614436:614853:+ [translate_table: standard]